MTKSHELVKKNPFFTLLQKVFKDVKIDVSFSEININCVETTIFFLMKISEKKVH